MAGALWRFWLMRDHLAEGRRWTEQLLALPAAAARTAGRARALSAAGSLAYWLRDAESVREAYEESLAIFRELGDRRGEAEGAFNLAFAHLLAGDLPGAGELHRRAAEIYRELGDEIRLCWMRTRPSGTNWGSRCRSKLWRWWRFTRAGPRSASGWPDPWIE